MTGVQTCALPIFAAPDRRDAAPGGMKEDLVSALVNLGYNARAASEAATGALDGAPAEPPFEDLLRRALRTLSR